jgi:RNA polymerase sigma factor (sigma-70 family)
LVTSSRDPTDAELLVASADSPDAFADFYRRHGERVLRYFAARAPTPEAAADLMAETFAAAFIAAPRYQPRGEPAVAWLFAIAHSKLVDGYRRGEVESRARHRLALEPLVVDDDDLRRIEDMAAVPSLEDLVTDLPAHERAAVLARVVEGRAYEDIAGEMRTSPAVIRKRVSRGLSRLRTRIEITS